MARYMRSFSGILRSHHIEKSEPNQSRSGMDGIPKR